MYQGNATQNKETYHMTGSGTYQKTNKQTNSPGIKVLVHKWFVVSAGTNFRKKIFVSKKKVFFKCTKVI